MDKLASLVSKLDMKLDKQETQYKPKIYKGRNKGCGQRQDSYRSRDRSYSRDHGQYNYRGRGNYNYYNRNYRSNYRSRDRSRNGYGNRRNDGQNYRRDNYRQNSNQRYRNRSSSQDHGRSRSGYRNNSRNTQIQEIDMIMIEIKSETETNPTLVTGKIVEQGLDQAHV